MKHGLIFWLGAALLLAPAFARGLQAEEKKAEEKKADETAPAVEYGFNTLTETEAAAGGLFLLDGRTLFGWDAQPLKPLVHPGTPNPKISIKNGETRIETVVPLRIATDLAFIRPWRMAVQFRTEGKTAAYIEIHDTSNMYMKRYSYPLDSAGESETLWIGAQGEVGGPVEFNADSVEASGTVEGRSGVWIFVRKGTLVIERLVFYPARRSLYDGTLNAWKTLGEAKAEVTEAGTIHLTGGSGSLESWEEFDDFCLSIDYKENASPDNSGLFFRTITGSAMDGYEAQLNNNPLEADRGKFLGNDTGSIFRRAAARRLVSDGDDWNRLTVMAQADFFRTWVNGVPALIWIDTRDADENPRKGRRFKRGTIQLQGHDAATDIEFRNIQVQDTKGSTFDENLFNQLLGEK